jgi:hypothetical protein
MGARLAPLGADGWSDVPAIADRTLAGWAIRKDLFGVLEGKNTASSAASAEAAEAAERSTAALLGPC